MCGVGCEVGCERGAVWVVGCGVWVEGYVGRGLWGVIVGYGFVGCGA